MKTITSLNGKWQLYYYNPTEVQVNNRVDLDQEKVQKISTLVPGNAEIALAEAGVISKELFKGMTTEENQKWEAYDWWYVGSFQTPSGLKDSDKVTLKFDAVDCFAEYYVNGKQAHTSKNAYIEQEFDVKPYLNDTENEIAVHILSTTREGYRFDYKQSEIDVRVSFAAHIRKPVHSYGWDIFPRAVSAGITRDVSLIVDDGISFKSVSFTPLDVCKESAILKFFIDIDASLEDLSGKVEVRIQGKCGDSSFDQTFDMDHFRAWGHQIVLKNPKLWWPSGYGDANLYETTITLLVDGQVKDIKKMNIGVRSVELKRTETMLEKDHCFHYVINGQQVFLNGSNWVPLSPYHSQDKERYAKVLPFFTDTHCNIVRVWGGGVYEQDEFYDYCDQHGICVWQDFMMACVPIDQSEESQKVLFEEVSAAVKRLRNHPSIIMWAGDNEIDEMLAIARRDSGGNLITREVIPAVLAAEDPYRPYLPSSPYLPAGTFMEYAKGKDIFVERHLWGARDYYKADFYRNSQAHFVSECGYHGCPSVESLKKMVDEDKLWPIFNEQWTLHSSDQLGSNHRVRLMMDQIHQLFGKEAENIEDFSLASQISQAEAKKFFIERMRIRKPYTGGIIWWNMMDGWPQMSDAVVDYYFDKKLAYDYIKRSQEPVALMFDEMRDWCFPLMAVNDTMKDVSGSYRVYDIDTNETLSEGTFELEKNSKATVMDKVRMFYSDKKFLVIEWEIDGKVYYNHYLTGYVPFDFDLYKKWIEKFNQIIK